MGDAMDGVQHSSRPIAKLRTRKLAIKKTSKRKSAGGSTETSSATSLNPTPSKKLKVTAEVTVQDVEQSWSAIAQNHAALLESHAQFLSTLLQKSQPSSSRTPALVGFLSRTHEMLAQVRTLDALSPPTTSPSKPAPNTSLPCASTPQRTKPKMETLSQNLQSIVLEKRKRTASPSPVPSPEKLETEEREESPMKKIKSAPETPVNVVKSSLKAKLGNRIAGAQYDKSEIPRTPTVVTASTSAASCAPVTPTHETKDGVKVEVAEEDSTEVSLMEPDDFAAEVAARLKAKEKRKHKLVEGSKKKRRRRSSTVDAPREKRQKRDNSVGVGHARRRVSGVVMNGDGGDDERGRR